MPKFINLMIPAGAGGTFLDWSILYLTAPTLKRDYIQRDQFKIHKDIPICDNPIANNTAHNHKKTHPGRFKDFKRVLAVYKETDWINEVFTSYTVSDLDDRFFDIIKSPEIDETVMFEFCESDIDILFGWQFERMNLILDKHPNIDTIFEAREQWALYYYQMIRGIITHNNNIIKKHNAIHVVKFNKLPTCYEPILVNLCDKLELKIYHSRLLHWKHIYNKWKLLTNPNFYNDINDIVNSIVIGKFCDLTPYNMTLGKEIIILRHLLFGHNLSLMAYSIGMLPKNTYDWHLLLEENVYHNLSSYKA